jgi:hypothetical protein
MEFCGGDVVGEEYWCWMLSRNKEKRKKKKRSNGY